MNLIFWKDLFAIDDAVGLVGVISLERPTHDELSVFGNDSNSEIVNDSR